MIYGRSCDTKDISCEHREKPRTSRETELLSESVGARLLAEVRGRASEGEVPEGGGGGTRGAARAMDRAHRRRYPCLDWTGDNSW